MSGAAASATTLGAVVRAAVAGMVGRRLAGPVSEALGAGRGCTDRRKSRGESLREIARRHRVALETLREASLRVERVLPELVRWAVVGEGSGVKISGAMSVLAKARAFEELLEVYQVWGGEGWPEAVLEFLAEWKKRETRALVGDNHHGEGEGSLRGGVPPPHPLPGAVGGGRR